MAMAIRMGMFRCDKDKKVMVESSEFGRIGMHSTFCPRKILLCGLIQ